MIVYVENSARLETWARNNGMEPLKRLISVYFTNFYSQHASPAILTADFNDFAFLLGTTVFLAISGLNRSRGRPNQTR